MAFSSGHSTTLISKGAEIIGDINFSGDLEVQGLVRGNIHAKPDSGATVRIVEGGCVEGEIHVPKVIDMNSKFKRLDKTTCTFKGFSHM